MKQPNISESYVHRIGRTARAGKAGVAIAFCDDSESAYLLDIENLTGQKLEVIEDQQWHFPEAIPTAGTATMKKQKPARRPNNRSRPKGNNRNRRNRRPRRN